MLFNLIIGDRAAPLTLPEINVNDDSYGQTIHHRTFSVLEIFVSNAASHRSRQRLCARMANANDEVYTAREGYTCSVHLYIQKAASIARAIGVDALLLRTLLHS